MTNPIYWSNLLSLSFSHHLFQYLSSLLGKNFVNIETQIMDILEVNDKEFSVTLTMYFNVQWDEPRIETNNTFSKGEMVPIDMMFLNHLWIPNIFIYDLRKFAPLSVLKKLAGMYAQQQLLLLDISYK